MAGVAASRRSASGSWIDWKSAAFMSCVAPRVLVTGLVAPELLQPRVASATAAVDLVAHRVLLIVILVVVLGRIERVGLHDLRDDGRLQGRARKVEALQ